ncbi:MAG: zeta toxin family protein [Propionibacteriaceae bacterium]|jgi:predicted ABC-type ATPase|nr:zeta toxin family protein [Propionibacteriaceae bacterium]
MPSPAVLVFAGPNGSGKSSVTAEIGRVGTYVNADEIKARTGRSDLAAAEEAERLREFCLSRGEDFTFETVLSTDRNLALLRRAREAGFAVRSVFVLTANAEINVLRVRSRVADGGHDVPVDKIRARFARSLANLPELARLSQECSVIDNTTDHPHVIYQKVGEEEFISPSPVWSEAAIRDLLGLANT